MKHRIILTTTAILALFVTSSVACDSATATPSPEGAVGAWLSGWESGSATTLLSNETETFLEFPSAMREELYDADFAMNNYTITNDQITVDSQSATSAEVIATFHIKIVGSDDQIVLEQDNSWFFILVKDNDEWLIASYGDTPAP